jgi:hypothetical protein
MHYASESVTSQLMCFVFLCFESENSSSVRPEANGLSEIAVWVAMEIVFEGTCEAACRGVACCDGAGIDNGAGVDGDPGVEDACLEGGIADHVKVMILKPGHVG